MEEQKLLIMPENPYELGLNIHAMRSTGTAILENLLVKANSQNEKLKAFIYKLTLDMSHDNLAHENNTECKLCLAKELLRCA